MPRRHRAGRRSTVSATPIATILIVAASLVVGFFAGTLSMMHSGLGRCDSKNLKDGAHELNDNVEKLAQKRLLGKAATKFLSTKRFYIVVGVQFFYFLKRMI